MRFLGRVVGLAGLLGLAGAVETRAQCQYYVAPTGSDSNPGTSGQPWATLNHASAQVLALGSQSVSVLVQGDVLPEPNERYFVNLSGATNATIADAQAIGTILDDEQLRYFTVAPCRMADTRNAAGPAGGPALGANVSRAFAATAVCGVPASAKALAVNATVTGATVGGNLRLYPADAAVPLASAINFGAGQTRANNAVVRLGTGGAIAVQCDMPAGSGGQTHFVLDVTGYFE